MYEWMDLAACRDHDPEMFHPKSAGATDVAKLAIAVCKDCPVISECYVYRKKVDAHSGVWHGHWYRTTDRDRGGLRADAILMHDEGMSSLAIAEELDLPRQRVASWISNEMHRRKNLEEPGEMGLVVEITTLDELLGDPIPAQREQSSGLKRVWERLVGGQ